MIVTCLRGFIQFALVTKQTVPRMLIDLLVQVGNQMFGF